MARTYANIDCGIWDPQFCALSAGAQRTYFMLITQADISACGSLALTLRRWAKTCSEKDLEVWLAELSDERYVLIDEDTEELLVRTFAKWDGGYKHAKRVMAVTSTARAIRSPLLREAVAAELAKLGVDVGNGKASDRHPDPSPDPTDSGRSVVQEVGYESTPQSSIQNEGATAEDGGDPPSLFCSKHPNGTEKPCGPCGTAKMRYARWMKGAAARANERRLAAENCPDCHGGVWLENGQKCTHPNSRRSA